MKADQTDVNRGPSSPAPAAGRAAAGFTLVELLVVIGIIAVLIAILLPALSRARQSAVNVNCLSNLRQLVQGGHNYAADYKGMIPYDFGGGNAPWRSYFVASGSNRYVRDYPVGWGHVFARGYIKTARSFYCPFALGTGSNNDFYRYWGKVGTGIADWRTEVGGSRARTGYMLNPYMIVQLARPDKIAPELSKNWPALDNLPPVKQIMAMDVLHVSTTHVHPQPIWNIATIDGSVLTYRSPVVFNKLAGGAVPGNYWDQFDECIDQIVGRKK